MLESLLVAASNSATGLLLRARLYPGRTPGQLRASFDRMVALQDALRPQPRVRQHALKLAGMRTAVFDPTEPAKRTVLYLHGGGYFMGSIAAYRYAAATLAARSQARVVVPEYRLAPEHPHPAALDDAVAAYAEVRRQWPQEPVVLAGDSAGGGLTLATLVVLRDRGLPLPARALTLSAWTDATGSGASMKTNASRDYWLNQARIDAWTPWYAGDAPERPLVSPVFADLRGLPPLLMLVGDQEVLLDDTLRVAERVHASGGQVDVLIGEKMQHDWCLHLRWLAESRRANRAIAEFVRAVGS